MPSDLRLESLFAPSMATGYPRSARKSLDETKAISLIFERLPETPRFMLDVGAHRGSSMAHFVNRKNWSIYGFEPDPGNRDHLERKFGKRPNVRIDPRAVSNAPATGLALFVSDESSGISALHGFHESHRESVKVDVTTVSEIVQALGVKVVDFLKIDVEGFDFNVLKGVPWEQTKPLVIECEYEDAKTLKLGHSWIDVCEYLESLGYTVYLSEWHPIVRYGVPHDWRRVVPYSRDAVLPNSWGNIVAFRDDPGYDAVATAFAAAMEERSPVVSQGPTAKATTMGGKPQQANTPIRPKKSDLPPQVVRLAEWAKINSPTLYQIARSGYRRIRGADKRSVRTNVPPIAAFAKWTKENNRPAYETGRFALWASRAARRYWLLTAGVGTAFVALLVLALSSSPATTSSWAVASAVVMAVGIGQVLNIGYTNHLIGRQAKADEASRKIAEQRVQSLRTQLAALRNEGVNQREEFQRELAAILNTVADTRRATANLESRIIESSARVERLVSLMDRTPALNITRFQRFKRSLTDRDVETFVSKWAPLLGISLNKARIGYLAHRAAQLEGRMKGRLATTIETIVMRSLVALATKRPNVEILEIGTLFGIGAAILYDIAAEEFEGAHLTIVDPLDGYYGSGRRDLQTGASVSERALRDNWLITPISEAKYTIIKRLSTEPEAITEAATRAYDVLIIDGDHSREGVKFDFDNYGGMVRPGGYILFDDYDTPEWPDIKAYVDEEVMGLGHLRFVGSDFRTAVFQVEEIAAASDSPAER